jgi:hypothetical protein
MDTFATHSSDRSRPVCGEMFAASRDYSCGSLVRMGLTSRVALLVTCPVYGININDEMPIKYVK